MEVKIKNLNDYKSLASRTCPDLGSDKLNLSHMALGLGSELAELNDAILRNDKVNISEELADLFWYFVNYLNIRDIELPNNSLNKIIGVMTNGCLEHELSNSISEFQDIVKKFVAYDKDLNKNEEVIHLAWIKNILISLYDYYEINVVQSLENNINKLKVRYPDKFSNENAINRDLDKERKELEKDI